MLMSVFFSKINPTNQNSESFFPYKKKKRSRLAFLSSTQKIPWLISIVSLANPGSGAKLTEQTSDSEHVQATFVF